MSLEVLTGKVKKIKPKLSPFKTALAHVERIHLIPPF